MKPSPRNAGLMKTSGAEPLRRLVLDTSAYSRMRAGHEAVLDRLAEAESVLMPATVLGELEAAFELGRRPKENRSQLAAFLSEPFVTVLPTTPEVARRYGQVFAGLRRAGTPIPVNDVWIAAAAIDCGGRLLTFDSDFGRIEGLDQVLLSI